MNQFRFLLSTLLIFLSINAFAYINEKVFPLSPNFHQLLVVSENTEGKCEVNSSKSVWMDQYQNQYLERLVSAKMVIKHAPENGYFSIQILAGSESVNDAINVEIIGNAWVVDSIVNIWTRKKAQSIAITESKKCATRSVLLVKSLNIKVH